MINEWKQKKLAAGFLGFLLIMWLLTLISKSVYASGLPQVTTAHIEKKRIEHTVEAEGIIRQGSDVAVHTLPGLRVERIFVRAGDAVGEGSLLFSLDKEELAETIGDKELEAARLGYQIADIRKNRSLAEETKEKETQRAKEDYAAAQGKGDAAVNRAEAALGKAEKRLKEHKDNPVDITSDKDRQEAYDAYEQWLEEQKETGNTVSGNIVEKPDYSGEDSEKQAWESSREALEDTMEGARGNKEDAERSRQDSLTQAGRAVEDSLTEGQADSTLEIYGLQLKQLKRDIEKYKVIYAQDGIVASEVSGTVTAVNLTAGERTPDGAAVVCADAEAAYRFEVSFTKEQKKYVNLGDAVTLKTAKGTEELRIDYLAEEENNPGSYRAIVYLPKGEGSIGMSGTLTKSEVSESFACCIPIDALHSDESGLRNYVYVLAQKEGILGTQQYAERRGVRVLDKNDRYAALEEGVLGEEDLIITGADKTIEDNGTVRMRDN